jgi:hypothetical protein
VFIEETNKQVISKRKWKATINSFGNKIDFRLDVTRITDPKIYDHLAFVYPFGNKDLTEV